VPILGICVGMQILAERSDEGNLKGLGYIKGSVKKIDVQNFTQKPKLPHMGWNSIQIEKENQLVQNIDPKFGFYFLHSYYFDTIDENNVLATTQYGEKFACAVFRDNVYGVQRKAMSMELDYSKILLTYNVKIKNFTMSFNS
jgi:glutamine amidotransferase